MNGVRYGRRVRIPIVFEYRGSAKTEKLKVNMDDIDSNPVGAIKELIELGLRRGWFKSGSHILFRLMIYGVKRGWDLPAYGKKFVVEGQQNG